MSGFSGAEEHDPAGVQALLNLLRDQQDQGGKGGKGSRDEQLARSQGRATPTYIPTTTAPYYQPNQSSAQSSSGVPYYVPENSSAAVTSTSASQGFAPVPSHKPAPDLRNVSFAQSLPILKQLAQDERFLAAIVRLKKEQDRVEEELASERARLDDAVHSTASSGSRANGKDQERLDQFDRSILKRWDEMTGRQQEVLQNLGVPCFFRTTRKADLKKQDQVMRMLYDFVNVKESDNTKKP